ncbi:ParM/StbA family protein [Bacillus thuringiensis]|uniref:ParM/StbA family protein n=1 Tax=Bacillus thuringiensis TaxID=1428 RepID=UPI0011AA9A26|nr:ParM/StbA family protein [Bacillus thuringiensis]
MSNANETQELETRTKNYEMDSSFDIGNASIKAKINGEKLKQPSVIQYLLEQPPVTETNLTKLVANLDDDLTVHITSNGIKRNGLYNIGKSATLTSDSNVENMNIRLGKKHKHTIPVAMTLGMMACEAVKNAFTEDGVLPSTINIKSNLSSAIPMSEYTVDKAEFLERRFAENTHVVVVYVGKLTVTVFITFESVKVTKEGVPSLYALIEADSDILNKYNEQYQENAKPKDFVNKKILHADIGDGTTEYVYTQGLNPIPKNCTGERRGVGHATEDAIKLLKEDTNGRVLLNRQQYMNILNDPTHRLYQDASRFLENSKYIQAKKILEDIEEKYTEKIAGDADFICVYGGGSIEFEVLLYEDLLEFCEEVNCKLLWIPKEYAVDMNMEGLSILNKKIFFKKG